MADFSISRGRYSVVKYTHGGLTPEEVIVPLLHLAPEPLQILPLTVTLRGEVRPRLATTLTLEVVNPNVAPLDDVVLHVGELPSLSVERIAPGTTITLDVPFPARPIEGTEIDVSWVLQGRIVGLAHEQTGVSQLAIRRLQTRDEFDDLFT